MYPDLTASDIARFEAKIDRSGGLDACHIWIAARSRGEYGVIGIHKDGKTRLIAAHRLAFNLANAVPLADDEYACHDCDNPPCCNPKHLFRGNAKTNVEDMMAKGWHRPGSSSVRGEAHPGTSLTESDVLEIRRRIAGGETQPHVARAFGVRQTTISRIALRKVWSHI